MVVIDREEFEIKLGVLSTTANDRRLYSIIKRAIDLAAASALLIVLFPIMLLIAFLVKLDGGSVFFRHPRVGRSGAMFNCLKFRSMVTNSEQVLACYLENYPDQAVLWKATQKLTADPRVTGIGRLLRTTSLDELPQLINVLCGEMSLVGPRPVISDELFRHYFPPARAAYLTLRPGITGLWQVSGRSNTTYEKRVAYDMHYARRLSLAMDLRILLQTIPAVISRRGAA